MEAAEDRQARRRVAKRAAIRSVAIRLALERGPDEVTVDDISAAADISPRTFFNYFTTKDEAFSIEPHQWTTEEIVGELRQRPAGEPVVESMRAVIKVMAAAAGFASLAEDWEVLQELYRRHPELFSRMRLDKVDATIAALAAEVASRTGIDATRDIYPAMLVNASFAALQAAENMSRGYDRTIESFIDDAFDLLVRGL
jgi:AcrR family transcriptional regulator